MAAPALHRFEHGGKRFVVDTETCFCFECDDISWAVLDYYPHTPVNRILHLVGQEHPVREVEEVIGELEWLRSTKSILPARNPKEQLKQFELAAELHRVDLRAAGADGEDLAELVGGASALLLGRAGTRTELLLRVDAAEPPLALAGPAERAFRDAGLAGKSLRIEVCVPVTPGGRDAKPLADHEVTVSVPLTAGDAAAGLESLQRVWRKPLSRIAGAIAGARVTLVPGRPDFSDAVAYLRAAGFTDIELDLPGAYLADPPPDPEAMLAGMQAVAVYYAGQLHEGNYFRLEPIASAFHQIYEGTARSRSDGSGTHELAVDADGAVYPSRYFVGRAASRLGDLRAGKLDEARRAPFDDLGALTTSPCSLCWARNLCGGGHSAIHEAIGGGIRTPDPAWCDSQRAWFAAAIAAFNLLSAHGVNFARLYANLQPGKKPGFWQAAKLAVTMKAGVRPIEEADAPLLTKWENWSDAVYFLGNEYGMFLATQYDREMDSIHPRGIEQELMAVSRRGEPIGLLKIRPEPRTNLARVWVYLRDSRHYADPGLRRSFGRILAEAAGHEAFSTLLAAAGPGDPGLGAFLEALGFQHAGTEREALFLHDAYHDIELYVWRVA